MSISITEHETSRGKVTLVTLTNVLGASVVLSSVGAGVIAINVPDSRGNLRDVVLGYDDPVNSYFFDGPNMGKTPGRYANRIARGVFSLDGKRYQLDCNCGPNHLHGGRHGFANYIWDTCPLGDDSVRFSLHSPDGDDGYPGNLDTRVTYTWSDDNVLTIAFGAVTDAPTPLNLTNHSYFNLHGADNASGLEHVLTVRASRWLVTDDSLAPTGEMAPVAGTPMDFTAPKPVGRDIRADFDALRFGKGYDNCWVLDSPALDRPAVRLESPISGIAVEIATDQPGVQVYTGNWLDGSPLGKGRREMKDYDAVAIECQGLPDAPNHPGFPSQILRPGEEYSKTIIFKFITTK